MSGFMVESIFGIGTLTVLVWLPVLGGLLLLALGRSEGGGSGFRLDRLAALGISVLTFVLSLPLWTGFDSTTASMQFVERVPWIAAFSVEYYLGAPRAAMRTCSR